MTLKLQRPFIIGARLLPALRIANATLTLRLPLYQVGQGRMGATLILEAPGVRFTNRTFRSGLGGFHSLVEPFAAFLAFLDAAAEARGCGENADLFPPTVMKWTRDNASAIAQAHMELCNENGSTRHELIVEVLP